MGREVKSSFYYGFAMLVVVVTAKKRLMCKKPDLKALGFFYGRGLEVDVVGAMCFGVYCGLVGLANRSWLFMVIDMANSPARHIRHAK